MACNGVGVTITTSDTESSALFLTEETCLLSMFESVANESFASFTVVLLESRA